MKILTSLTKQQAQDLFPEAIRALDASPGDHDGDHVFAIVMLETLTCYLATWEQQPTATPQGALYWNARLEMWDL